MTPDEILAICKVRGGVEFWGPGATPDEARELREISEMFDYQLEIVRKEDDDDAPRRRLRNTEARAVLDP